MKIAQRLAEARLNRRAFPHPGHDVAGKGAEYVARAAFAGRLEGTGWRVHHGVRVPAGGRGRGRRELDLVLTGPEEAWVIELKNWVGRLVLEGDRVVQIRRPPKRPIEHGPIFRDLAHRVRSLRAHHVEVRDRAACPPLHPLVLFFNPSLGMPGAVRARPDVATFEAFLHDLPRRRRRHTPPEPSPAIVALRRTLDDLGGWDIVRLHGGRTLFGDVIAGPPELLDRRRSAGLQIHAARSRLRALFAIPRVHARLHLRAGGWERQEVSPTATISVRSAGRARAEPHALRHVRWLTFGSR